MGPPAGGFDTSQVWSPSGGWFCDPKAWKRNTFMGVAAVGVAAMLIFNESRKLEVSVPPNSNSSSTDLLSLLGTVARCGFAYLGPRAVSVYCNFLGLRFS